MNKHYSREKVPFREPWKKKRKERKKEALHILIDSLDFLIKGKLAPHTLAIVQLDVKK